MLVYGSKTFAVVVRQILMDLNLDFGGYVDDFSQGPGILGPYNSVKTKAPPSLTQFALGVGYNDLKARARVAAQLEADGYAAPVLIHPRAWVHPSAKVGHGAIVMAGALIDAFCEVGPWTVIWPGAVVNHESRVGANTFLSPNSTVCGCVEIGADTFIGAGAVIVDHCSVPPGRFVKAGKVPK
jgi:sugar O-acyltransferase (sialic acid O-acetyltransferase NeuD family)